MPTVASLEALERAAAESTGLLLLGEVHGVRENPLVIRALMVALGLTCLVRPRRPSRSGR